MFEKALTQALTEPPAAVPAAMVQWVVTGQWPRPALRYDVAYPRANWSQHLDM